jgi:hypothetical protein
MVTNPNDESLNEVDRNKNVYLDDADAIEKTTYAGDAHGADVGEDAKPGLEVTAPVNRPGGLGTVGWITLAVAALALAIYATGLF